MKTDAGWYTDVIINIKYTLQRHGGVVVVVVVGEGGCLLLLIIALEAHLQQLCESDCWADLHPCLCLLFIQQH